MLVRDRRTVGRGPTVAPLGQRDDDGLQLPALGSQYVLGVPVTVRRPQLEDASLDELAQPLGQDVGRDAQVALEVGEAGDPGEHRVADDEQAPPLSDDLECARGRADLTWVQAT